MIIDGKQIAEQIQNEIAAEIQNVQGRKPCLTVIMAGEHPASQIYVSKKLEACSKIGIHSAQITLPNDYSECALLETIKRLNLDDAVDGILVQLPLPAHINPLKIIHAIDPNKDVDGFHPLNMGKLLIGETDGFVPCTPLGIQVLLQRSGVEVTGKNAVIFGRSNIVGKPLAALMMQTTPGGNATVTIAHSRSRNIKELSLTADILVAAIGKPYFITKDMVKKGAVVIDVGINKIKNPQRKSGYQIVGDVDFDSVKDLCSFITPVPGGVGPMTIAMLLSNTWKSYQNKMK
jgi:methylenetetrahydrofolate dehydrogenase (NADP+)/methenyltetrahydrofolate cyclohydrolase